MGPLRTGLLAASGAVQAIAAYYRESDARAVLDRAKGSGNAFSDGTANVQAFSAIGVLAGMFSDRVAQWLSTRATSFLGDATADERDGGKHTPAPAAPVPAAPALPPPGGE